MAKEPTPLKGPEKSTPDFFADDSTVEVELAPGYWVELKRQLDYGELVQLEGTLFSGMTSEEINAAQGSQTTWKTDSANFYVLRLALYIVDWNLPGKNGKVTQLPTKTAERMRVIRALHPKWARQLAEKIDELEAEQGKVAEAEVNPEGNPTKESGPASG